MTSSKELSRRINGREILDCWTYFFGKLIYFWDRRDANDHCDNTKRVNISFKIELFVN